MRYIWGLVMAMAAAVAGAMPATTLLLAFDAFILCCKNNLLSDRIELGYLLFSEARKDLFGSAVIGCETLFRDSAPLIRELHDVGALGVGALNGDEIVALGLLDDIL